MTRYPTHLHFDASGTAIARFFGSKLAGVRMHWNGTAPRNLLACPRSIGLLGRGCRACDKGDKSYGRSVALCWDVEKKKWAVLVAHVLLMERVRDLALAEVGHMDLFASGHGPDIVIQRHGKGAKVATVPGTCLVDRGLGTPPPLEDFLRGMESRSTWSL